MEYQVLVISEITGDILGVHGEMTLAQAEQFVRENANDLERYLIMKK